MEFDWYAPTLDEDPEKVVDVLREAYELAELEPVRPRNGYAQAVQAKRGDIVLATAMWGGSHREVHTYATGPEAPEWAAIVRREWPQHRVARADVREDYTGAGAWEQLQGLALSVADEFRVQAPCNGDFHRGKDGRTQYVGSPASPVRLRVYEKGKQLLAQGVSEDPFRVRSELQVRPEKREQKERCAVMVPAEFFGASRWSKAYHERLTGCEVQRIPVGTVFRESDRDRALRAMAGQYGKQLTSLLGDLGGDLGSFGEKVWDLVTQAEESKRERERLLRAA